MHKLGGIEISCLGSDSPAYIYRSAAKRNPHPAMGARQRGTWLSYAFRFQDGAEGGLLESPALDVLNAVPRIEGNPFVICGEKAGRHLVDLEKPWRRIRKAAKFDDVRLHDLRHSFASVAASGGQSLVVIGKMLGHSQPATTARYAHLADDPVRAASDAVGRHIAAAMGSGKSGEVVNLNSKRPRNQ